MCNYDDDRTKFEETLKKTKDNFDESIKRDKAFDRMRQAYAEYLIKEKFREQNNEARCTCCKVHPRNDIRIK